MVDESLKFFLPSIYHERMWKGRRNQRSGLRECGNGEVWKTEWNREDMALTLTFVGIPFLQYVNKCQVLLQCCLWVDKFKEKMGSESWQSIPFVLQCDPFCYGPGNMTVVEFCLLTLQMTVVSVRSWCLCFFLTSSTTLPRAREFFRRQDICLHTPEVP